MYWLQKRSLISCLLFGIACASGEAEARSQAEQSLRSGFDLAQACESEIDDDMTFYGECIGHAMDRMPGQKHVLLGLHFQAWLMADLAARQNSPRAVALRQQHLKAAKLQLRATGTTLNQLCRIKQLSCNTVRLRMGQHIQ
jgi:hypothetical protein